ncbi:MAG: hypothetical protein INH37_06560 [Myxococcaceae bacterium]|nr:hypothetical protein [Myxococcaceae bacterium]
MARHVVSVGAQEAKLVQRLELPLEVWPLTDEPHRDRTAEHEEGLVGVMGERPIHHRWRDAAWDDLDREPHRCAGPVQTSMTVCSSLLPITSRR